MLNPLHDIWIDRKIYEYFYEHRKQRQRLGMPEKEYQKFLKRYYSKQWKSYKKALKTRQERQRFTKEEAELLILPKSYVPRYFK